MGSSGGFDSSELGFREDFHGDRATILCWPLEVVEENALISILYLASDADDADLEREIIKKN